MRSVLHLLRPGDAFTRHALKGEASGRPKLASLVACKMTTYQSGSSQGMCAIRAAQGRAAAQGPGSASPEIGAWTGVAMQVGAA